MFGREYREIYNVADKILRSDLRKIKPNEDVYLTKASTFDRETAFRRPELTASTRSDRAAGNN
jgi:hypothetical protein